jgi:hypothetical protein
MVHNVKVGSLFVTVALAICGLHAAAISAQKTAPEPADAVFVDATIAAHNIEEAITEHITSDPSFHPTKQLPEDRRDFPPPLITKDGGFDFDWTLGQHARYLMEALRQGIHTLQSAVKPSGLDGIALAGARESWPKMRDISCHESPGIRYYDLDGFEQYCPKR